VHPKNSFGQGCMVLVDVDYHPLNDYNASIIGRFTVFCLGFPHNSKLNLPHIVQNTLFSIF